jgi:hypothetical protein
MFTLERKQRPSAAHSPAPKTMAQRPIQAPVEAGSSPPVASVPRFNFARISLMPPSVQRKATVSSPGVPSGSMDGLADSARLASTAMAGSAPEPGPVALRPTGSGRPLDPLQRAEFEKSFGHELGDVRLHSDSAAARAAESVDAAAYTIGHDIVFGADQLRLDTVNGRHLLAHELAHTLQQAGTGGLQDAPRGVSHPNDPAEHEADRAADAVIAGRAVEPLNPRPAIVARQHHKGGSGKYKVGHLQKPAGWVYVAYLDQKKAHLVYKMNAVGTLDWATNNPGSVDYDWPSVKNDAVKAGADRSFEKDAGDPGGTPEEQLIRRLSIYSSEAEGRAAVFDLLALHGAKTPSATLTQVLVAYKGLEPSGQDLKIILRARLAKEEKDPVKLEANVAAEIMKLDDAGKRQIVKEFYIGLITASLRRKGFEHTEIQALLTKPFKDITRSSKEYDQTIDAVVGAEGAANPPGVEFEYGKGLTRLVATVTTGPGPVTETSVKRTPSQERIINELFAEKAAVEAELAAVLDGSSQ